MPPAPESDAHRAAWLDRALALLATVLPFTVALTRAASAGQWRDDLPAVRDLGLVAVGLGGGLSTLLTQALSLLPLGPRTFRAAFGSALALALASRLLYGLVRRTLDAATPSRSPRLASALALIAALTAALSPTWQREATVGGGAMLAAACTLAALTLALRCAEPSPEPPSRRYLALGALLGITFAESPPAGLAIAASIAAIVLARRFARTGEPALHLPSPRLLALSAAAALFTAALLLAPLALRPLAPRAWVDVGRALSAASLAAFDSAGARTTALAAWTHEIGLASLAIATLGAATSIGRPRTRALIAPFLALLVLDTLLPARAAGVLSADPLTALRALAVAAIAVGSALGVHAIVRRLLASSVPMARTASVLVVVFHLTLVALASEEASFAADRSEQLAAEVWTDEALGKLPARSAVLVKSPAIAWRLWAARLTRGERPDVMVIPVPLLDRGRVAASLVASEREIEPLLRDFALDGEPGEFALSKVADVRPLHVEFDAAWSKRLTSHLTVDGMWLQFAPEPLGPSDRRASTAGALAALKRVDAAIAATTIPDAPTASVVARSLRAEANVLAALGEGDAAGAFLERIGGMAARDPFVGKVSLPYALKGVRRAIMVARRENETGKKDGARERR